MIKCHYSLKQKSHGKVTSIFSPLSPVFSVLSLLPVFSVLSLLPVFSALSLYLHPSLSLSLTCIFSPLSLSPSLSLSLTCIFSPLSLSPSLSLSLTCIFSLLSLSYLYFQPFPSPSVAVVSVQYPAFPSLWQSSPGWSSVQGLGLGEELKSGQYYHP